MAGGGGGSHLPHRGATLKIPPRLSLARTPTPLEPLPRLSESWGGPTLWVKRDDLTGFELSGNKVRKLEYHLAAARRAGADAVITCGALQSNHCRATALACARMGLSCVLFLRTPDGDPPARLLGNHLLHRLTGARIRFVTPGEYEEIDSLMAEEAASGNWGEEGRTAWVIPEGASDALGMWGYVEVVRELSDQMTRIEGRVAALWHAASSGGTTAGLGWGIDRWGLELPVVAVSVGDPAEELRSRVSSIWAEAAGIPEVSPPPGTGIEYLDDYLGKGYGATTPDELRLQAQASALTGLLFDPTYTGKALYGLHREIRRGRFEPSDHVVFLHTGGGFAAFAHGWESVLG